MALRATSPEPKTTAVDAIARDIAPMEARSANALPVADGPWQYEPKYDGFRCLAFRDGADIELRAKSGKPLGRYFPEIAAQLAGLPAQRFVVDGELVIERDGAPSFDALQMRLHPAESRIRKLAAETPARYVLFDMLQSPDGRALAAEPLSRRREALSAFVDGVGRPAWLMLSPATPDPAEAEALLSRSGHGATDGVVAKRLDGPYEAGVRAMVKVKRLRSADCVVGGFRYGTDSGEVGSLLLGLYDEAGLLNHVGFTSGIAAPDRAALTARLEALREPPGFTGKAPGGPSRWSTERSGEWEPLKPALIAEVRYDHVTGDRFRHGTKFLRWRPDKAPRQCTMEQIGRS